MEISLKRKIMNLTYAITFLAAISTLIKARNLFRMEKNN